MWAPGYGAALNFTNFTGRLFWGITSDKIGRRHFFLVRAVAGVMVGKDEGRRVAVRFVLPPLPSPHSSRQPPILPVPTVPTLQLSTVVQVIALAVMVPCVRTRYFPGWMACFLAIGSLYGECIEPWLILGL